MVLIVVSVLLSTTNCSTWRFESSRDRSCEVSEKKFTNSNTYLVVFCIAHSL